MVPEKRTLGLEDLMLTKVSKEKVKEIVTVVSDSIWNNKKMLLDEKTSVYLIKGSDKEQKTGFISVADYPRQDNSSEITLHLDNSTVDVPIKEILSETISMISKDSSIENIFIRIKKKDSCMEKIVESLGFLKDGLFISNQFEEREFIYYTLFKYKLT